MSLTQVGFTDQPFDHLYLLPIGAELPSSISKSFLNQLNATIKELLHAFPMEDQHRIAKLTQLPVGVFPLAVVGETSAYPYLIQPDYFLWKKQKQGLQLTTQTHHFDTKNLYKLSETQLKSYLELQLTRYAFTGKLISLSRKQWKAKAQAAYSQNPFIELAREKRDVIEAVEVLNRSMLLGVLNPPEDVAFWRHRVEIVLRPYRALPEKARYAACKHPIKLEISKSATSFTVTCEECNLQYGYYPLSDQVVLPEEPSIEQAKKRIATIERQFNDLAEGTPKVIRALQKLQQVQLWTKNVATQDILGPGNQLVASIREAVFPHDLIEPTLLSLQHVKLATIDSLRFVQPYLAFTKEEFLNVLQDELEQANHTTTEISKSEVVYFSTKGYELMEEEVDVIEDYLARDENMTFHLLIQVLKGEATSKVRSLNLHTSPIFGLLRPWPKKLIPQAIKSFW
ncbi:RQC-minor-2 family DNA-binding protein [Chryseomicrobium imtechense]